jgi:hypothetical protein
MEDTGWAETSEPEHTHYCTVCHSNWQHEDEVCPVAVDADYDCPACVDGGRE